MHVYCFLSLLQPGLALNFLCSWDDLGLLTFLPASTLTFISGMVGMYPLSQLLQIFSCTSYCCLNGFLSLILCFFMQLVMPGEEGSVTTLCYRSMLDV